MPSNTPKLKLKYHTTSDVFRIQDYTDNWFAIDANPGVFVCTSGTRPSDWTSFDIGRHIFETDTGLVWVWDGSDFVRSTPRGYLDSDTGNVTASDAATWTNVASVTVDVVERPVQIIVSAPFAANTDDAFALRITRDDGSLDTLISWVHNGNGPIFAQFVDTGAADGSVDYEVDFEGPGSPEETTITDLMLSVIEI